jgi:hypothetical protein
MNSQKIISLAAATSGSDCINRDFGDSSYILASTVLNSMPAPSASLNMNSYKITNLANATQASDALNQQTGDARYYAQTVTLD